MTARPRNYIPSVRARRLAANLRHYRDTASLSLEMASASLDWSRAKLGHIETCKRRVSVADVGKLLDLYGVVGPRRDATLALARDATLRNWWTEYSDVLGGGYVAAEDAAHVINIWEKRVIPGLFQTAEYAREVIGSTIADPVEVERRVDARLIRQKLLSRHQAPTLQVVLDEAVLEHPIPAGNPGEWREQLHRLVRDAGRPNVNIQVLPKTAGAHPGLTGSFVLLSFEDFADPPVVHCEGPFGDIFLESPGSVAQCNLAFGRLCAAALDPAESAALIEAAATR